MYNSNKTVTLIGGPADLLQVDHYYRESDTNPLISVYVGEVYKF